LLPKGPLIMTNLPDDCQRLLELARDGHDPVDPDTRVRVRQAVAASIALSAAAGGSVAPGALPSAHAAASSSQVLAGAAHTTLGGKVGLAVFASKLGAVATAAVAAAGIGYGALHTPERSAPVHLPDPRTASMQAARTPEPTVHPSAQESAREQLADQPPTPDQAPLEDAAQADSLARDMAPASEPSLAREGNVRFDVPRSAPKQQSALPTRSHASTLRSETALLRVASDAIARGDEAAALAALAQHAQQFPRGSLREERDGLRAIAECTRDTAPSAASAEGFTRTYPHSMLSARVAKACAEK
jgi:hypothetical protein